MKMSFIRYKASSRDILWLTRFANKLMHYNIYAAILFLTNQRVHLILVLDQ